MSSPSPPLPTTVEISTSAQLYADYIAAALIRPNGRLNPASFSPGFIADLHAGAASLVGNECQQVALALYKATRIRYSQGADLDAVALDYFGITRQQGVAAIGNVTFSRPTTGAGNVLIPAGTIVTTASGTAFQTTIDVLMIGLSISVPIVALQLGQATIVTANTITLITTTVSDGSITVTNPQPTAGGIDAATDTQFQAFIAGFFSTLRRGTVAALIFGALATGGVANANVDETTSPINLYIADVTGGSNNALVLAVQANLINYRAAGVAVNVFGATLVNQPITLHLVFKAGFATQATQSAAIAAVVALVNSLNIGQTLYESAIVAAASVPGISNAVVSVPTGDVVPTTAQILRTSTSLVTLI